MKLRFTRRALENLIEIAVYLEDRNPAAALRVRDSIDDGLKQLLTFPYAGRPQTTEGVRKLVVRKYHYLAYYVVSESSEEVVVLSIKHAAQKRDHDDS